MFLKTLVLTLLIGSLSAAHVMYHGSQLGLHILHQQLFFIPLILASFWFGLRVGFILATVISLLYGLPMVFRNHDQAAISFKPTFLIPLLILIAWPSPPTKQETC